MIRVAMTTIITAESRTTPGAEWYDPETAIAALGKAFPALVRILGDRHERELLFYKALIAEGRARDREGTIISNAERRRRLYGPWCVFYVPQPPLPPIKGSAERGYVYLVCNATLDEQTMEKIRSALMPLGGTYNERCSELELNPYWLPDRKIPPEHRGTVSPR